MNSLEDEFLPYKISNIDAPFLLPLMEEINESAEIRAKCLDRLRQELKNLQGIEACLEENFLLRFLRVSKFDLSKALQRVLKYYQQQEKILESLKQVSLPLSKALTANQLWLSPYRMPNHSLLLYVLGGKVNYSRVTFAERFYLDILALNGALENPVNQMTGATVIFDYKGFNARSYLAHTPLWMIMFVETFVNAFPIRLKAIHIVNAPSLFKGLFRIIYPVLSKKIQERLFVHPDDDWKSLHASIPPEILLAEYGGQLAPDTCINALDDIPGLQDRFLDKFQFGKIQSKRLRQAFRPIP